MELCDSYDMLPTWMQRTRCREEKWTCRSGQAGTSCRRLQRKPWQERETYGSTASLFELSSVLRRLSHFGAALSMTALLVEHLSCTWLHPAWIAAPTCSTYFDLLPIQRCALCATSSAHTTVRGTKTTEQDSTRYGLHGTLPWLSLQLSTCTAPAFCHILSSVCCVNPSTVLDTTL